jgi:hypothetical protein
MSQKEPDHDWPTSSTPVQVGIKGGGGAPCPNRLANGQRARIGQAENPCDHRLGQMAPICRRDR